VEIKNNVSNHLKYKKISIIGCGWLGFPLAQRLTKSGYTVKATVSHSEKLQLLIDNNVKPYLFNINTINPDKHLDFLDAEILVFTIPPSKIKIENLMHFLNQLNQSVIKQVILISSTGIYKDCNTIITEENSAEFIDQLSLLYEIEQAFKNFKNYQLTVLQLSGLIGYDRNPVNYIHSKKVLTNPNGKVNMIYRDDAILIIEKLIKKNSFGETYLCSCDEHPTKKEYYTLLAKKLGIPYPDFETTLNDNYKVISNQKIKEKLNFVFTDLYKINVS